MNENDKGSPTTKLNQVPRDIALKGKWKQVVCTTISKTRKPSSDNQSKTTRPANEETAKPIAKSAKQKKEKKRQSKVVDTTIEAENAETNSHSGDCERATVKRDDCDKDKEDNSATKEITDTSFVDPLSVDLYDRLQADNGDDKVKDPWDNFVICDDLQKACKKLSCSEKTFYVILVSIFFTMTLAMVFGLLVLQSQISMVSREIVTKIQASKKEIPPGKFDLYFDFLESDTPDRVDLRANTTIFVH